MKKRNYKPIPFDLEEAAKYTLTKQKQSESTKQNINDLSKKERKKRVQGMIDARVKSEKASDTSRKNVAKARKIGLNHPNRLSAAKKNWKKAAEAGVQTNVDRSTERIQEVLQLLDGEFKFKDMIAAGESIGMTTHWTKRYVIYNEKYIAKVAWGKYKKV